MTTVPSTGVVRTPKHLYYFNGNGIYEDPSPSNSKKLQVSGITTYAAAYQRMAVDTANWPTMGQLIPVAFSPKNPDNWVFAPPE